MVANTEDEVEYRSLLEAYGASLGCVDGQSMELLQRADATRARLNAGMTPQEQVSDDMHLVLAYSLAVEAVALGEARRLYSLMSSQQRAAIDAADHLSPGQVKPWSSTKLE